jgi:hypothetical protein
MSSPGLKHGSAIGGLFQGLWTKAAVADVNGARYGILAG